MPLKKLIINRSLWVQMREHVQSTLPEEACGLLAGIDNRVTLVLPVNNILKSSHHYRMDAQEQLTCFLTIEKHDLELLGIYHSHPEGPPFPSETDIVEAYYPETPYLIWAMIEQEWICQAFLLKNQEITPITIKIEDGTT